MEHYPRAHRQQPGAGAGQRRHQLLQWHATNAFYRDDDDRIYRTYMIDGRGDEAMGGTWAYLDITALGRQEEWEDSPEGYPQTPPYGWWNYHDNYGEAAFGGNVAREGR